MNPAATPPEVNGPTGARSGFRLWRDRNFLSLILGGLFSVIGDGAYFIKCAVKPLALAMGI